MSHAEASSDALGDECLFLIASLIHLPIGSLCDWFIDVHLAGHSGGPPGRSRREWRRFNHQRLMPGHLPG